MKIGMFVSYFSIVKGGAESYVADLSHQLLRMGHDVTVVTGRSLIKRPVPARTGIEIVYAPCLYELRELGRLVPGRVAWLAGAASESFHTLFARRHIGRFDIVHCHGYENARSAIDVRDRRGPIVLTMHGAPTGKARVGRMLRSLDAVVSPSLWIRDLVQRQHGLEPIVIPMGVDLERFVPGDRAEARRELGWPDVPTILFVGRLVQEKDVPTLLRAFRVLLRRHRHARLVIAGDGVLKRRLAHMGEALGISRRIRFLGSLSRTRLARLYRAADLMVLPSVHENFPMVTLEALACGTPLIVSSAVEEITRRFPVASFPAGDHATLAAHMMRGVKGDLPQVDRASLSTHSWGRIAASYAELYVTLAGRRAA